VSKTIRIVKLNATMTLPQCCDQVLFYFPSPLPKEINSEIERLCAIGISPLEITNYILREHFKDRKEDVEKYNITIAKELKTPSPNPIEIEKLRRSIGAISWSNPNWQRILAEILTTHALDDLKLLEIFSEYTAGRVTNLDQATTWLSKNSVKSRTPL
jgi:hypothetical protein